MEHSYLKHLDRIWIEYPFFFITTCTDEWRTTLINSTAAPILLEESSHAKENHDWSKGRYVIMPNHVHSFCAPWRRGKGTFNFHKILEGMDKQENKDSRQYWWKCLAAGIFWPSVAKRRKLWTEMEFYIKQSCSYKFGERTKRIAQARWNWNTVNWSYDGSSQR